MSTPQNGSNGSNGHGGRPRRDGRGGWDTGRSVWLNLEQRVRLRTAMQEAGYQQKQVAAAIGYGEDDVSKWLRGRRAIPLAALTNIATLVGTSLAWVLGPPGQPGATPPSGPTDAQALDSGPAAGSMLSAVAPHHAGGAAGGTELVGVTNILRVPLYGRANAGPGGGLAAEGERVPVPGALLKGRDALVLLVRGDCMDEGYYAVRDGDYILVDAQRNPQPGEAVAVRVKDTQEVLFKLWEPLPDGRVALVPRQSIPGVAATREFALDEIEVLGVWYWTLRGERGASLRLADGDPPPRLLPPGAGVGATGSQLAYPQP